MYVENRYLRRNTQRIDKVAAFSLAGDTLLKRCRAAINSRLCLNYILSHEIEYNREAM